jgi:hypothetical protein
MAPKFWIVNLLGGGADTCCATCLTAAIKERGAGGDASLVSVAEIDEAGAYCVYCGAEGDEDKKGNEA